MRWIVGLDLRPRSFGALHFATWLGRTAPAGHAVTAVHVLEPEHLRAALKYRHMDEVVASARAAALEVLAREAPGSVPELEILDGMEAHEGLADALSRHQADALVVGRIAERSEVAIVRLGRVARQLVRRLPAPVVVVPPDVAPTDLGAGPVVALTSLDPTATEACRFAARVARAIGRPLLLLHVVSAVELPFLRDPALEVHALERRRDAERALEAWVARERLHADALRVEHGDVLDRVGAVALDSAAPLVVAGAASREGLDRFTSPGLGRELAAIARLPVAIVPSRP